MRRVWSRPDRGVVGRVAQHKKALILARLIAEGWTYDTEERRWLVDQIYQREIMGR